MSKLGLLKDSDFRQMHDSRLPVAAECADMVQEFISAIEKDVRFLQSLRIMDYSLFLIILQVPKSDSAASGESNSSFQMYLRETDAIKKILGENHARVAKAVWKS